MIRGLYPTVEVVIQICVIFVCLLSSLLLVNNAAIYSPGGNIQSKNVRKQGPPEIKNNGTSFYDIFDPSQFKGSMAFLSSYCTDVLCRSPCTPYQLFVLYR